jgi:DNA helicase-2/ATP-dependent DNA helicase PcrA
VTLCKRCDSEILAAAEYVANQDLNREPKALAAENSGGLVRVFAAADQYVEAQLIATVCRRLNDAGYEYPAIAILLRSDYLGRFSEPIAAALSAAGIPVSERRAIDPLSEPSTRRLLALARLAVPPDDSLAVRTVLQLASGIGGGSVDALESLAVTRGDRFSSTVRAVAADMSLLPSFGGRIAAAWNSVEKAAAELVTVVGPGGGVGRTAVELRAAFSAAAGVLGVHDDAVDDLMMLASQTDATSLSDLLSGSSSVSDGLEPRISSDSVNMMTMHQAKGLTFDCVLIPGLEDELVPGGYDDPDQEGDQRRLLYVSMTRAKHALVLFYATKRTGAQAHSGRGPTTRDRRLSRFLSDYKFKKD